MEAFLTYQQISARYNSAWDIPYSVLLEVKEWKDRREQILKRDCHTCVLCKRQGSAYNNGTNNRQLTPVASAAAVQTQGKDLKGNGWTAVTKTAPVTVIPENRSVILHVHHLYYVLDNLPWEYGDEAFLTLCHQCHQEVHQALVIPVFSDRTRREKVSLTSCLRCGGAGFLPEYQHYKHGICFRCQGKKYEEYLSGGEEKEEWAMSSQFTGKESCSPLFRFLLEELEFFVSCVSVHYPFSEEEILAYWDVLEHGSAHYPVYLVDTESCYSSQVGLCFNQNIRWTEVLRSRWTVGFNDPFNGYLVGTGEEPVEYGNEKKLQQRLPLNLEEHWMTTRMVQEESWVRSGNVHVYVENGLLESWLDLEKKVGGLYSKLAVEELRKLYRELGRNLVYNRSIWYNTLYPELKEEDIFRLLRLKRYQKTLSGTYNLDSEFAFT